MSARKRIGICITNINQSFVSGNLLAISEEAKRRGYDVRIFSTFSDLYRKNSLDILQEKIFTYIKNQKLDALVMASDVIKDEELKQQLVQYANSINIPVISMKEKRPDCLSIVYDSDTALKGMIEHLINVHGCRKIKFITGLKGNPVAERRLEIFKSAMAENNLKFDEKSYGYGDFWEEPARQVTRDFTASEDGLPDAIVCANDAMGIGVIDELKAQKIRVPHTVKVTGLGGIRERDFNFPRVSTAIYDPEMTAKYVLDAIENIQKGKLSPTAELVIPCKPDYSESCGCVPAGSGIYEDTLSDTYNKLQLERSYQHELNELISDINREPNLNTLVDRLEKLVVKPGIKGYNLLLMTDIAKAMGTKLSPESKGKCVLVSRLHEGKLTAPFRCMSAAEIVAYAGAGVPILKDPECAILFPLCEDNVYFGFIVIDYGPWIIKEQLYRFMSTLNICLDIILKKATIERVNGQLNLVAEQTILSLAEIVEAKSEFTGLHVKRVSEYTRVLATALGFDNDTVDVLRIASMMHDIGKLYVPSEIIEKPGKLTSEEFEIVKTHVTEGEKLLKHSPGKIMQTACIIAKEHHEWWNGHGYLGLSGEDIAIEARIVAVADVFDALVSVRPYKGAYTAKEAYEIILEESGTHFDPSVVEAFKNNFDAFVEILNSNNE